MKTIRTIIACAVLLLGLFAVGCASKNIEAGSSRLSVTNPMGKSLDVVLPKNLDAVNLQIVVNPKTGEYMLSADKFTTDASTVIETAASKQADTIGKLADTLREVVPLAAPPAQAPAQTK